MATPARLTPRQRRSLKQDGYLLVPSLLGGDDLARITARLAEHVHQTVATWAKDPVLDIHEACVVTQFCLDDLGLARVTGICCWPTRPPPSSPGADRGFRTRVSMAAQRLTPASDPVGPGDGGDAAGAVRGELAKLARADGVRAPRACRGRGPVVDRVAAGALR